jgi:hypothetical protein
VNRSVNEGLVLEGLEMGQKGEPSQGRTKSEGPWRTPSKALSFPRKDKKRGPLEDPFKSFVFPKEGQKARALGGDGMMEVIVLVSYTINIFDIQFPPHQNNIIITFTMVIVAMRSRLIPSSSGGVIHG